MYLKDLLPCVGGFQRTLGPDPFRRAANIKTEQPLVNQSQTGLKGGAQFRTESREFLPGPTTKPNWGLRGGKSPPGRVPPKYCDPEDIQKVHVVEKPNTVVNKKH